MNLSVSEDRTMRVPDSTPFFSLIVVNYNNGDLIGEALSSAIAQTFSDFEVIVSDNCSTDNSWEVVCSFSDPRINAFRQTANIGMYPNLNFAVSKARGLYLKFLNSDDVLHPQCLEILESVIQSSGGGKKGFPVHLNHGLLRDHVASGSWLDSVFSNYSDFSEVYFAMGGLPDACVDRERFIASGVFGHPDNEKDFSRDVLAFGLSAIGVKKICVPHLLALERIHANQSRHSMMRAKRYQLNELLFVYSKAGRFESTDGKKKMRSLAWRHLLSSLKFFLLRGDPSYLAYVFGFVAKNASIILF